MPVNNNILIYREQDRIAFIEINRPEKKNALNWDCWKLLDEYLEKLGTHQDIRALVITGHQGDVFSAGVDVTPTDKFITEMFHALEKKDKEKLVEGFTFIQNVLSKLAHLPIPTVAAINGLCYSGAVELATACDIRVAKDNAIICLQETRLGLIPDLGGTVRLARLIGPGRAKDLIFTARELSAHDAKELGLIEHILPDKQFMDHVLEYVRQITANSPSAVSAVKQIINATTTVEEDEALKFEREQAADNVLTGQCLEGIAAFLEKRDPEFDKK